MSYKQEILEIALSSKNKDDVISMLDELYDHPQILNFLTNSIIKISLKDLESVYYKVDNVYIPDVLRRAGLNCIHKLIALNILLLVNESKAKFPLWLLSELYSIGMKNNFIKLPLDQKIIDEYMPASIGYKLLLENKLRNIKNIYSILEKLSK